MYRLIIISLVIILTQFYVGCSNQNQSLSNSKSKGNTNKIIYIEYDTTGIYTDPGRTSLEYYDLSSRKQHELINNNYFISSAAWTSDGNQILFASARSGDNNRLQILGNQANKELYTFNIKKKEINLVFDGVSEGIYNFIGLQYDKSTDRIYFSNEDNKIYSLSVNNKLSVIYEINADYQISDLLLSNDAQLLAIEYFSMDLKFGISVINLNNLKEIYNFVRPIYVKLLGWNFNYSVYISDKEYKEIDVNNNKVKVVKFNFDLSKYKLEQLCFKSEKTAILLLGEKSYLSNSRKTYKIVSSLIGVYNIPENQLRILINDGTLKSDLGIY